jgi:2-polyprenyl-6-methoxyphenol hydroxylase-like FAD-dependent oxidoreductase
MDMVGRTTKWVESSLSMNKDRVIVVGAGPVGLTTALTLARYGVPVTVIEAEDAIVRSPRAIVYHPPTIEAVAGLGLMDDFLVAGLLKQELEFRDLAGTTLAKIDYRPLETRTKYPYNLHLGQDDLAEIVLAHLQRLPGTEVLWGHRLTAVSQRGDTVTATATTRDGEQRLDGRWLVGADGAGSGTRRALGLEFEGKTWPNRFVATNVRYDFEADGYARATFVVDPDYWAIIVIVNDHPLWRVTFGEDSGLPVESVEDRIRDRYKLFMRPGADYDIEMFSPYRIHERAARSFRVGRALLAGDAAHANNPIGGYGLTSGLLDAVALGYPLAAVFHGLQDESILDRYAEERRKIFLKRTSPAASENLRRFEERDPTRKAEDLARFRRLREDREFNLTAASFTFSLASPDLASPALLRGLTPRA